MRDSVCFSSSKLLMSSLKRDEDLESIAETDWLYAGGCGRNGRLRRCLWASEVEEDDWYKLVQNTEDREYVLFGVWT